MNVNFKMDFARLRDEMVEKAVFARGVRSELVLNAMRAVPREAFLPSAFTNSPIKTLRFRSRKARQSRSHISLRS